MAVDTFLSPSAHSWTRVSGWKLAFRVSLIHLGLPPRARDWKAPSRWTHLSPPLHVDLVPGWPSEPLAAAASSPCSHPVRTLLASAAIPGWLLSEVLQGQQAGERTEPRGVRGSEWRAGQERTGCEGPVSQAEAQAGVCGQGSAHTSCQAVTTGLHKSSFLAGRQPRGSQAAWAGRRGPVHRRAGRSALSPRLRQGCGWD